MGALRRLVREARKDAQTNTADPVFLIKSLEASSPNSKRREHLVYMLLAHGAWPDSKTSNRNLFDAICELFDVDSDELMKHRLKFNAWKENNLNVFYRTGAPQNMTDENDRLSEIIRSQLNVVDMHDLHQKLITQASKNARHFDWRPDIMIPEDYYSL